MEVGTRLFGIILRLLCILIAPICWLKSLVRRTVPPLRNPLLLCSVKELADFIRTGEHTSEEIVSAYIDRVKEVNPYINAVVDERYRAALDDARTVDRELEEARWQGTLDAVVKDRPLLGVPFTVKESCSLAGLSNSTGCIENAGSIATSDGGAVKLLRKAGAIALLVSNTPELCLGWETTNLLRGTTNNPYCLNRTAGGSSGGEAALLGAGASAFSVSSDIAGSIRLPAAFCGVFGLKPTPGIVPIDGHIPTIRDPMFPRFLALGPMTRRAQDLPLLLQVMAGDQAGKLRLDEPVDVSKLKVYYMTEVSRSVSLLPVQRCISDAILRCVNALRLQGCTIKEEKFPELDESMEMSVATFFSMKGIPNMLQDQNNPKCEKSIILELIKSVFGGAMRTLQILAFTLLHRTRVFVPRHRVQHYATLQERLLDKFTRTLGTDGVFIYPVFHEPAHHHNQVFVRASGVMYLMVVNVLGLPAVAAPAGTHGGLPLALQVIAAPHQDRLCLAVAEAIEKIFGGWQPPC